MRAKKGACVQKFRGSIGGRFHRSGEPLGLEPMGALWSRVIGAYLFFFRF